jgi:hypothetical protein
MKKASSPYGWQYWVFVLGFFLVGTLLLYFGINLFCKENAIKDWPQTVGKIEKSKVYSYVVEHKTTGNIQHFGLEVSYQYMINGKTYHSTRIRYTGNYESTDVREINKLKNALTPGKAVRVYYNPIVPQESVLFPDISNLNLGLLEFGIIFILISLIMFAFYIAAKVRSK